jgi:hypothetical protein
MWNREDTMKIHPGDRLRVYEFEWTCSGWIIIVCFFANIGVTFWISQEEMIFLCETEVFKTANMKNTVLLDCVTPFSLVNRGRLLEEPDGHILILLYEWWTQQIPQRCWYLSITLYGVTSRKTIWKAFVDNLDKHQQPIKQYGSRKLKGSHCHIKVVF